jgi:hypothetical protein
MEEMPRQALTIPDNRFDNAQYIEERVMNVDKVHQGALRTTLKYLYLTNGPKNLPSDRKRIAEQFLDAAERVVVRWLQPRTNGQYRGSYGSPALKAARQAHYRCQECGFADVRTLELDHVEGRRIASSFSCLCANCHKIKSRAVDWTGQPKRV